MKSRDSNVASTFPFLVVVYTHRSGLGSALLNVIDLGLTSYFTGLVRHLCATNSGVQMHGALADLIVASEAAVVAVTV
jgi:hypothetical protein